jgi:hypothetical protein
MDTFYVLTSGALPVIILELFLWFLFRRKVEGLCLPTEKDSLVFRWCSILGLRFIIILHTLFLLGILFLLYLFLW